jgi:hypothetical protein
LLVSRVRAFELTVFSVEHAVSLVVARSVQFTRDR